MVAASEVATESFCLTASSTPTSGRKKEKAGTSTTPAPMPNRPARKPAASPARARAPTTRACPYARS